MLGSIGFYRFVDPSRIQSISRGFQDSGVGVKSRAQGAELYQRACDAGVILGCIKLGYINWEVSCGLAKEEAKVLGLNQDVFNSGDDYACD